MRVYLGLGANLGDRKENIVSALRALKEALGVDYSRISSIWETEAWGFEGDDFLNLVVCYDLPAFTSGEKAPELLKICKEIERTIGRTQKELEYDEDGKRVYENRLIDIDILFFGNVRLNTEALTIPHPLIAQREFVMKPLLEIADDEVKACFPEIFEQK